MLDFQLRASGLSLLLLLPACCFLLAASCLLLAVCCVLLVACVRACCCCLCLLLASAVCCPASCLLLPIADLKELASDLGLNLTLPHLEQEIRALVEFESERTIFFLLRFSARRRLHVFEDVCSLCVLAYCSSSFPSFFPLTTSCLTRISSDSAFCDSMWKTSFHFLIHAED